MPDHTPAQPEPEPEPTPEPAAEATREPAEPAADAAPPATPALPRLLVFRPPAVSLVVLAVVAVCASPVALALPWFWVLYLFPLAGVWWVLRTRTVVDADKLVVRRTFSRTRIPWNAVASLRMRDKKWLSAVLADGSEIALPEVRTRHLPILALITGGRIADPTAEAAEAPAEVTAEAPAAAGNATGASTPGERSETDDRASDQPV